MSTQNTATIIKMNLDSYIRDLAQLRRLMKAAKSQLDAVTKQFQESPQYVEAKAAYDRYIEVVNKLTSAIKATAEGYYRETEDNRPHDAVLVKVTTKFEVTDEAAAIEYCKASLPQALSLNKTAFKKMVLAMSESARPESVRVSIEPQVTIATDLSQWLEGGEPDGE